MLGLFLVPISVGCSNDTGPTAGALNLSLTSPHKDDGAVLLLVYGGPVDSVESTGYSIYSATAAPDTVKLIVTGKLGSGRLARIHIPDSRLVSSYAARVGQVAARATYVQRDPARYAVTLLP